MAVISLEEENARKSHPDYNELHRWLEAMGINPMFVRIPSQVQVHSAYVIVTEYVHDEHGQITLERHPDGEPPSFKVREMRYARANVPLPALLMTKISNS